MNSNGMQRTPIYGQSSRQPDVMNGAMSQGNGMQYSMQPQMQPVIGPNGQPLVGSNGMPIVQASPIVQVDRNGSNGLLKTIVIIILSLTTIAFAGLFIWKQMEYASVQSDVNGQISDAVEKAKYEQKEEDLAKFSEEEKYPLRPFTGPVDYGQLSFEYPKTWSLYIASDAANGGNYVAYFNPLAVEAISDNAANALRLVIYDEPFESVVGKFQKAISDPKSGLTMSTVEVNGIVMNRYVGKMPGTDYNGAFVIFKIRDKSVLIRTDAEQFMGDFDALLQTISFNA